MNLTQELKEFSFPGDMLFGSETYLVDRAVPDVEVISLAPGSTVKGLLRTNYIPEIRRHSIPEVVKGARRQWAKVVGANVAVEISEPFLDLRLKTPQNWAHSFTNHLPLSLKLRALLMEHGVTIATVLLPDDISTKLVELYELAGFEVVIGSGDVVGPKCDFSVDPWIGLRGERVNFINEYLNCAELVDAVGAVDFLGAKLFISRRDTRKLVNQVDIESYLKSLGYQCVYLEDYSVAEQIAALSQANEIIAVHGAALGPLIMRSLFNSAPYRLLEIFSPAHVTNVYRVIAHQQHSSWCGVRGKPWPKLFTRDANFRDNLQDFEVCLNSLKMAVSYMNER